MKFLSVVAAFGLVSTLAACGGSSNTYEIAMITDVGAIDDESFNQGTWEGIVEYAAANNISHRYYRPPEVSNQAYIGTIDLAVEDGARIVVTPGFQFAPAVYFQQKKYPEIKFIFIDGVPHPGDFSTYEVAANTVSILFAEHQSGFLAAYATVKDGYRNLGFMGGIAFPAVVRFGVGFIAGAYYAANELGVDISFPDNRYAYLGSFDAADEHGMRALAWFNSGTEVIFAAAGTAGLDVMAAAETANKKVVGVDVDQSSLSPTVLTSAMKDLAVAVQQVLADVYAGEFPGGQIQQKNASNNGVALAIKNSRFTTFSAADYSVIYEQIATGTVIVPDDYDSLVRFLTELGRTLAIAESTIRP